MCANPLFVSRYENLKMSSCVGAVIISLACNKVIPVNSKWQGYCKQWNVQSYCERLFQYKSKIKILKFHVSLLEYIYPKWRFSAKFSSETQRGWTRLSTFQNLHLTYHFNLCWVSTDLYFKQLHLKPVEGCLMAELKCWIQIALSPWDKHNNWLTYAQLPDWPTTVV